MLVIQPSASGDVRNIRSVAFHVECGLEVAFLRPRGRCEGIRISHAHVSPNLRRHQHFHEVRDARTLVIAVATEVITVLE